MLCFPFGVSIARNKEALEKATDRPEPVYLGGLIGILFMGVTQLPFVKELPYLYQNVLSLFGNYCFSYYEATQLALEQLRTETDRIGIF